MLLIAETYIVPSCLPTMLSEVVGESLPYLGKLTKTWIACHSHTGGIQFNSIQSILYLPLIYYNSVIYIKVIP